MSHYRNAGRKPECDCSNCKNCKQRLRARKHRAKKKTLDSDLEVRLIQKFKEKGWD